MWIIQDHRTGFTYQKGQDVSRMSQEDLHVALDRLTTAVGDLYESLRDRDQPLDPVRRVYMDSAAQSFEEEISRLVAERDAREDRLDPGFNVLAHLTT